MFRRPRNGTGMLARARGRAHVEGKRGCESRRSIEGAWIAQDKIKRIRQSISRPRTCWAPRGALGMNVSNENVVLKSRWDVNMTLMSHANLDVSSASSIATQLR